MACFWDVPPGLVAATYCHGKMNACAWLAASQVMSLTFCSKDGPIVFYGIIHAAPSPTVPELLESKYVCPLWLHRAWREKLSSTDTYIGKDMRNEEVINSHENDQRYHPKVCFLTSASAIIE